MFVHPVCGNLINMIIVFPILNNNHSSLIQLTDLSHAALSTHSESMAKLVVFNCHILFNNLTSYYNVIYPISGT